MENPQSVLKNPPQSNSERSYEDYLKRKVKFYNAETGPLKGYDCPKCLNRGNFMEAKDGNLFLSECVCAEIRRSFARIERSGLKNLLENHTMDKFQVKDDWQKRAKDIVSLYIKEGGGRWLFIGGQVGSGKTHLCTAACGELLSLGTPVRYMLWKDAAGRLKACISDDYAYQEMITPYKTVKVLYIDDFLKTQPGEPPTKGDLNLAFEILNYRYINPELTTIISSEKLIEELLRFDEAVGSRIYQRSKDFCIQIKKDESKNYRICSD